MGFAAHSRESLAFANERPIYSAANFVRKSCSLSLVENINLEYELHVMILQNIVKNECI